MTIQYEVKLKPKEIIQNRIMYGTPSFAEGTQVGQSKNFNLQTDWLKKGRTSGKIMKIKDIICMYITLNVSEMKAN